MKMKSKNHNFYSIPIFLSRLQFHTDLLVCLDLLVLNMEVKIFLTIHKINDRKLSNMLVKIAFMLN